MQSIFIMLKVKSYEQFEKAVYRLIKKNLQISKRSTLPFKEEAGRGLLFHCYVQQDIFRISTGCKVQDFDFSHFKSEETICNYIARAIEILRQHFPPSPSGEGSGVRFLLDDYTETISLLR